MLTLAQHVLDALDRVRWIDRHVGRARLERTVHRDHHVQRSLRVHADRRLDGQLAAAQLHRYSRGEPVELAVCEVRVAIDDGDAIGRAPYLSGHLLVNDERLRARDSS